MDAESLDKDPYTTIPPDENAEPEDAFPPPEVELATVCVIDGVWQDQPDNIAAFIEARLGSLARGRGNLYVLLDVSGDLEGRAEVERALIETLRESYANTRGSVSFGLSEALRAVNSHLYDLNLALSREQRRLAGISAVALRGDELYIAQAGPAVVYVEASEKLTRFPLDSDWFTEDAPLISPQGNASAPLGIRREFVSDLAHVTVATGDVFVLATRGLTQLATTDELAVAFTGRTAQDIGTFLEGLGDDADVTALVAELLDPHAISQAQMQSDENEQIAALYNPSGENVPAPVADFAPDDELDWETELAEPEPPPPDTEHVRVTEASAAAMPMMGASLYGAPAAPTAASASEEQLERMRIERQQRRAARREGVGRAFGGIGAVLIAGVLGVAALFGRIFGFVDWHRLGRAINRGLNQFVTAVINLFLLLVRLVLPGTPTRQASLIPKRATSDPVWLKAMAIVLPVLFIGLAGARFVQQQNVRDNQMTALVNEADTLSKQAESITDRAAARTQLNLALAKIRQAGTDRDPKARSVLYKILDQLNELDGVAVLYFLPTLAQFSGQTQLTQFALNDQDLYLLDHGTQQLYHYLVNDTSGTAKPAASNFAILKAGDKVGDTTVNNIQWLAWSEPDTASAKPALVAVTDNALLSYDFTKSAWTAQPVSDASKWTDLRAASSFGGNVYLLDGKANQIYKYTPSGSGFADASTPYFPANSQVDFSNAVDMAIDGDIWVLNKDGSVLRYRAGTFIPFELTDLDIPLKNPTAIHTAPEVDSIYIADGGNQRIVEFDKNGKFVRQFKPYAEKGDVFKNLKDFYVNEAKRKLYFIGDTAVYLTNVPK